MNQSCYMESFYSHFCTVLFNPFTVLLVEIIGSEYLEDNIPHIEMLRTQ